MMFIKSLFLISLFFLLTVAAFAQEEEKQGSKMLNLIEDDYILKNYQFKSGQSLAELRLHYATFGTPIRDRKGTVTNAVLFLHWSGASGADLMNAAFSKELYGPDQALDLTKYFIIVPDNIGHGRSSKPSDGLHAKFPNYRFADMVDLQHRLVTERLGIPRLRLILGLSIGGMHAWMWGEQYPDAAEALMPVVSLPAPVSGRNALWRKIITEAVRSDPEWKNGNYIEQPHSWTAMFPLTLMMLEGVPQLQQKVENLAQAEAFVKKSQIIAAGNKAMNNLKDANDMIYSLESSADYDPRQPERIKSKIFALNFEDDEFNPVELNILPEKIKLVKNGSYFIIPTSPQTHGHSSMAYPELWSSYAAKFLRRL